jgi:FkbM family methyltransferase
LYKPIRRYLVRIGIHPYLKTIYWALFDIITQNYVEKYINKTCVEFRYKEPRQSNTTVVNSLEFPSFPGCLDAGDVFYDIGAHRGIYTCFAAKAESETSIIAIEPGPAIGILNDNIDRNNLSNVNSFQLAFGKTSHSINIPSSSGGMMVNIANGAEHGVKIPVLPGDEFVRLQPVPCPTIAKIDVEGAEKKVIRGMEESLKKPSCRLVLLELHYPNNKDMPSTTMYGDQPNEVLELLQSYVYTITQVGMRGPQRHYRCEK